jgi:hypothetical protein
MPAAIWAAVSRGAGASDDEVDSVREASREKISESLADSMHDTFAPAK